MLPWRLPLNQLTFSAADDQLAAGLMDAFQQWLTPLNMAVSLRRLPQAGLIRVRWGQAAKPTAVAWTEPHFTRRSNCPAFIQVILVPSPAIDATLTPLGQQQRLAATFLHETGHALGLDHSMDPLAVMHRHGWRNHRLSPDDHARIRQKYSRVVV